MKIKLNWLFAGLFIINISCSGSDDDESSSTSGTTVDGSTVTAEDSSLAIAGKLSIIPPSTSSSLWLAGTYDTDKENIFVNEDSLEALGQAETIMCYIAQTKFETQVNKGAYFAIIDNAACETKQHDSQSGEDLTHIKMLVTREEGKPIVAKGWILEDEGDYQQTIHLQIRVAEGPSDTNPLGVFELAFEMGNPATGETMGGGTIISKRNEDGSLNLIYIMDQTMVEEGEEMTMKEAVQANLTVSNSEITGGKVSTLYSHGKWKKGEYKVTFNSDHLSRQGSTQTFDWEKQTMGPEVDGTACLDRKNFRSEVYRYGIYNADGSVKKLNSGFQIEATVNGKTLRGNLGYHGLWLEGKGNTIGDGQKVKKIEWTDDGKKETEYTLRVAPGKLFKYSEKKITLGKLAKAEMSFWDNATSKNYLVKWDGTNKKFTKYKEISYGQDGRTETDASGDITMPEYGLQLHVEELNANINIPSASTLSDSLEIRYHSRELVSGTITSDLELKCFSRCPKLGGATQSSTDQDWAYQSYTGNKKEYEVRVSDGALLTYKFKAATKNLYDSTGTTAFKAPTASSSEGNGAWINSGVLLTATQLATVSNQNISPWEMEGQLKEYYSWESSSATHGQYYGAIKTDGTIEKFDKPMEFQYTHSTAQDYDGKSTHDGKYVRLEYGGQGNFWGIPWKKAEGAGESGPIFSIKSGTKLTDSLGGSYTLKALEVAQHPTKVDAGACAALSIDGIPELPPKESIIDVDLGDEPADADTPLRVEKGEVI